MKPNHGTALAKLFALIILISLNAAARDLILADGGKTDFVIYIADDATPSEKYASEELAKYLNEMTGATFPIESQSRYLPCRPAIVLNANPELSGEEYSVVTDNKTVVIYGGRPRGVLYGVYALLEEKFHCRWYTPDVESIPKQARLALPALKDFHFNPRMEYRDGSCTEANDGDWAARNRLNSQMAALSEKHGGRVAYGRFVHTFRSILDARKDFKQHPEYFSMVQGKRIDRHEQLCLSNPEVLRIAIATVNKWIADRPDARIFSVSQNDWLNPCECPACKAIDDAEGSHAGSLIRFVNAIAESIEKKHPNVLIDTLAYQYTRKPPITKPRANVVVRLCTIECCFSHPLGSCTEATNTSFMDDLKGWRKLTPRLYIWDYVTNFQHFLMPFPNLDVLDKNIRTFAENGVVGVFEEGNYSAGGGGELAGLRAWVLAKLLWNPALDGRALCDEYVRGVYGPAAEQVQAFLDLERSAIASSGEHVRVFDPVVRKYLSPAMLRQSDAILEKAEQIAVDARDDKLIQRVKRLRMPVWYTQATQASDGLETVVKPAARRLVESAKAFHITAFREGGDPEKEFKHLEFVLNRKPHPESPGSLSGESIAFSLAQEGALASLIPDEKAEGGIVVRQPGRGSEWSLQWHMPLPDAVTTGKLYWVFARIRVDKKGSAGAAFHSGVYDALAGKTLFELTVPAGDVQDEEYHWYTLGQVELGVDRYGYVAPNDNEDNVSAIYTDRFELLPIGHAKQVER